MATGGGMPGGRGRIVIAAMDDLFFLSKIGAAAGHLGITVIEAPDRASLERQAREEKPDLVVLDLQNAALAPVDCIRAFRGDPELAGIRLVGFYSHVDAEALRRALEAGCDLVVPRSKFSARLPEILQTGKLSP